MACSFNLFILLFSVLAGWEVLATAGWTWVIYCFLWGGIVWYSAIRAFLRVIQPTDATPSATMITGGVLAIFAFATVPPFVVMAMYFDRDTASSGSVISSIGPVSLSMVSVFALAYVSPRGRRLRLQQKFEAQFHDGPVGRWRSRSMEEYAPTSRMCKLEFTPDGHGRLDEWDLPDDAKSARSIVFRWRMIGQMQIEISIPPATVRELEMDFRYETCESTHGSLLFYDTKKLAALDLADAWETDNISADPNKFDDIFWPSAVYNFIYIESVSEAC